MFAPSVSLGKSGSLFVATNGAILVATLHPEGPYVNIVL